ncbi:hypothetical protein CFP56_013686 [Quercus suber]|uniref:Endonuclease/exonuclease/phosphatase domain-containing protein n=1 Tax=Quercus suber TaxID=58331 RepID=A0AAW0KSP5_QUESU
MVASQINVGDIKKDDDIKHGGCTVEIERSNQVPLGGNVQIKNGESGLDRAVATADWILKFPTACLHHLPGSSSDHKPLWLVSDDLQTRFNRAQKPFRFEAIWLKDERCEGVVHSVWDKSSSGDPVSKVLRKVGVC